MGAGLATTVEEKKSDSSRGSSPFESPHWEPSRFTPSSQGAWSDDAGDSAKTSRAPGAPSGMPLFLQPQVQMKCAECTKEENENEGSVPKKKCDHCEEEEERRVPPVSVQKKCAHCEEEEKREHGEGAAPVQAKCAACEAEGLKEKSTTGAALDGVASANRSLPHLDRIQASFGRHDVSGARAAVGGPAAEATGRMGALAYTSGDSMAFRSEPSVNLAAHEAAHVVQQRNGAKLPGGVGRPGDEYEQQADAAAAAVERGQSAEAILDAPVSGDSGGDSAPAVQHRLEVNATRMFEPVVARSDTRAGDSKAPGKAAAGSKTAGKRAKSGVKPDEKEKEESGEKKSVGAQKASASVARAPTPGSGPASGTQPVPLAGGQPASALSTQAPAGATSQSGPSPGAQPARSSISAPSSAAASAVAPVSTPGGGGVPAAPASQSCAPECFRGLKEEPKDKDKTDEKPKDVPGGDSEEKTKEGDEPDAPEPDDCKTQQAQAGVPPAGGEAAAPGSAPAPAASAGPSPAAASAPLAAAPATSALGTALPTAGGGKAPSAVGGGAASDVGGQASAGGKAVSPMEGSIAQSEAQRTAAVASLEASSQVLDMASANSAELRSGVEFAAPATGGSEQAAQTSAASARATQFFVNAADNLEQSVAFASIDAPDLLGAEAEASKAQIVASAESQKETVSARLAAARDEARADASMARGAVVRQAGSFIEQVQTSSAAAIATLTATHASTLGQVDALETSTLDQVNRVYAAGRNQMEGVGVTIGNECSAIGEQFASKYETLSTCTENGFWDGDLSERRAAAQAKAARKTASGYHDTIIDKAKKRAREVAKDGRKKNRCQVITTAGGSRQELDKALSQLITAIETARDHAIEQAGSTRATLLTAIDGSLRATLRQLDQQEHEQRQTIDDTGYLQQVLQEQMAHSAAASLQGLVTNGASALHDSLFALRSQFASNQAPDPKELDEALTAVSHNVDAALETMQKGLQGGTAAAVQQLEAALGTGVAALERLVAANDETTSTVSRGFGSSMGALSSQDNFAPQRAGFRQMVGKATTEGNNTFQKIFGGMRKGCGDTVADSQKSLKQAAGDLEKNLRQSRQGLECQITKEADEAASHEAPAWKMLIAILLIIIVIVIVIAVTVLTAGAGLGLIGVLVLGAVVGGVTSGLIAIATNLWNNQPWHEGVGKAILIGAITGAAGGALGMGIGSVAGKVLGGVLSKAAVEVVSLVASTAVMDVGSQFYAGGFSFKKFSWGQLGFDLALALVLHKVGKVAEARRVGVTAPEPTVRPSEPAAMEPTPAEAVPAEPVPAESAPAKPSEPAPEATTPPEPSPAPPEAAKPTPSEAAPTAPEPKEPSAPSEPGVPEETPPAAPREAPTTPQERQVLERTATKSSEELTPEEVLTEREVASRTEGEPIEDPPFTTKKELPNGHEIEETPQGQKTKRCSKACAVFNADGQLEPEVQEEGSLHGQAAERAGDVAHDVGVQQGREVLGGEVHQMTPDPEWVNPFEDIGSHGQGFDDVLKGPNGEDVIAEYKGGSAELSEGQMEREWVQRNINRIRAHAEETEFTRMEALANRLQASLDAGTLRGVTVSSRINPATGEVTTVVTDHGTYPPSP